MTQDSDELETPSSTSEEPPERVEHVTEIEWFRPWLYPKQFEAIYDPRPLVTIEATTKAGKTLGCLIWLLEKGFLTGAVGRNYWWVAPVSEQADDVFTRALIILPPSMYTANRSHRYLILPNGALVWFKSADRPDTLYGRDVYAAVLDEASRMKEDAFDAVRTTVTSTNGPMRIIGNVKGRRNWFYKLARRAQQGEPGLGYHKITAQDATDAGVMPEGALERAARDFAHKPQTFRELYFAEPSDDSGNPFGLDNIASCLGPTSTKPAIAFGVDLGKSQDWTVVTGLDDEMVVCVHSRWQKPWTQCEQDIIRIVGARPCLVDSTGLGDPVLAHLQDHGRANFEGFKFTSPSKQQLMEGLAGVVQQREVQFPDGPIRQEMEAFEYTYTRTGVRFEAPPGYHDDCVDSLALAVMMHAQQGRKPPPNYAEFGRY